MEQDVNKQRGAGRQSHAESCDNAMLSAFRRFQEYMSAATTPRTKLISSETMTRREVLAANRQQQLITVSTTRTSSSGGPLSAVEYVETLPVPLPHSRGGILAYITYDEAHGNAVPSVNPAQPQQARDRHFPTKPYGTETLVRTDQSEWGFAGLVQECVRTWAVNATSVLPGRQRDKELSFATAQILAYDPESLGRMSLNPHPDMVPPGNPFAALRALSKALPDAADRAVLYRAVGLEMMKLTYGLRAKNIVDTAGMGLKPEAGPNDRAEYLWLARVHAEFDPGAAKIVGNITEQTYGALLTTVASVYRQRQA